MIELQLKKIRIERALTQEEVAISCGVSRQTIISLENGTYNPSLLLAFKLAEALSVSITDLVRYNP